MDLIEALDRQGIHYVLTHHENTGAFMAAAVGRLDRVPGVVLVTKGPGMTNVATGIGSAHLDRAPLLLFSSHVKASDDAITARQHIPAVRFFEPITKLSAELTAANAHELLPRAVRVTTSGYLGPAYLPSLATEQVKEMTASHADLERLIERGVPDEPSAMDEAALEAAASVVASARRLVVLAGPGVEAAGASIELVAAIESLGALLIATPQAVGQVPADHPLWVGLSGWHDAAIDRLVDEADLILTAGLDGADVMIPRRKLANVVNLAPTTAGETTYQPVGQVVMGDLRVLLSAIADRGRGSREWTEAKAAVTRAELERDVDVSPDHDEADGIAPQRVVTDLRELTPRGTIFTCDVGAHKIVAGAVWKSYGPDTFFISNGFGSMGYGLATAMGVKLARPDRPVVSVIGDGGLLMYAGDLATWARLNLPLTLVVMVDSSLTQVQRRQEQRGYSLASTTFQRVDYCALARSFGIDAIKAESTTEYRAAVSTAVKANRPVLVEAVLDAREYRRIPGWR
jgi:acetolactate synthase-1/2/3 large subunit